MFYVIFSLIIIKTGTASADSWFYVRWVDDGDTIVLDDGRRLRYIGVNAPELEHNDQKAEPHAYVAKNVNKKWVLNKRIRFEFDEEQWDRYGRLLVYVFLENGMFVNKMLLKQGYAYLLYRAPNVRYNKVFLEAQRDAMRGGRGIWSKWKKRGGYYIANTKSKRFHLETCPYGKKIAATRRKYFRKKWDAFWEGYAPGKKCFMDK